MVNMIYEEQADLFSNDYQVTVGLNELRRIRRNNFIGGVIVGAVSIFALCYALGYYFFIM